MVNQSNIERAVLEGNMKKWGAFVQELRKVTFIATPMVAAAILQYMLQVVTIIMVGHLGSLALSSVAIATSLTNVVGFSLNSGLVGGMETLCGQAYGAKQYRKLGMYLYTAIISLMMVCVPICVVWIFMGKLFVLMKQDPSISHEVGKYSILLTRNAAFLVIVIVVIEAVTVSIALFFLRHILGRAFTNQKQVIDYFGAIVPFISISVITDSLQAVISGIARGCGWQKIGAWINLLAFYVVGLPLAVVLGLQPLHLKVKGFWIGIVCGSIVQATILSLVTCFTNWQK